MGQVLGFSHCQEYGSVASTPDSTPPCTDGGNDESELYELQTAREWSDDDGDEDQDDDDDDEGLASSPSSWFTPRQNSLELTFSYIAIAEAEAVGTSRQLRDRRNRGGGSRTASRTASPLIRADTLETLLDLPDVEWNPHAFLSRDEEEEAAGRREREREEERTAARHDDDPGRPGTPPPPPPAVQPPPLPLRPELEPRRRANEDIQREERETDGSPSPPQTPQQHGPPSQSLQVFSQPDGVRSSSCPTPAAAVAAVVVADADAATPPTEPESPLAMETSSVTLLASARPRGGVNGDTASAACCVATGQSTQEEKPVGGSHWFSGLDLPEDLSACVRIAVMDLIYWKETERSGMVLTGLVVGLLSLFQLSIITVLSTLSLAAVCVTISVRVYYQILHVLNWGDGEHPFKAYLALDTSLRGEQAEQYTRKAVVTFLSALDSLRNLIFVGNVFDSLKFLALMYLLTFLGKLCNGLTLLIIGMIALFSLPLYYRQNQEQVDSVLAKIHAQVANVSDILQRLSHGGSSPPAPTAGGDDKPKSQ